MSSIFAPLLPAGMSPETALGIIILLWLQIPAIAWLTDSKRARMKIKARQQTIEQRREALRGEMSSARRRRKTGNTETMTVVRGVVAKLKLVQQHQGDILQKKLIHAGFRSKDAIVIFALAKTVMPFLGLAVGFFVCGIDWSQAFSTSEAEGWLVFLGLGYAAIRSPEFVVSRAKKRRNASIQAALPDALDLMMVCAEAGLSLGATLDRVAREFTRISPEIAEELSLTSVELGFMPERSQALKNLGERVDLKEVAGLVNVVVQTEKYGTPVAQALRTLSKEYRTQRMLRAEQKAAALPAIMTVPMMVFIMPVLFVIIITPAVQKAIKATSYVENK